MRPMSTAKQIRSKIGIANSIQTKFILIPHPGFFGAYQSKKSISVHLSF